MEVKKKEGQYVYRAISEGNTSYHASSKYSGCFVTEEEANTWYNKHGKWLEDQFDRTLMLFKSKIAIPTKAKQP